MRRLASLLNSRYDLVRSIAIILIVHSVRAPKLSPAFQLLGDCSLGIYLSHCIFISAFTLIAGRLGMPAK